MMRSLPFVLSTLSAALKARVSSPLSPSPSLHLSHIDPRHHFSLDVSTLLSEFNINSGGLASGRFTAEHPDWTLGTTILCVDHNAVFGSAELKNFLMYKSHKSDLVSTAWEYDIPVMEPGLYDCNMHFADADNEAFLEDAKVSNLSLATNHGQPHIFPDIDIYRQPSPAHFTVSTMIIFGMIIPVYLYIRVEPSAGDAILSSITCERIADLLDSIDPGYSVEPSIPIIAVGDTEKSDDRAKPSGATKVGTEINFNVGGQQIGRLACRGLRMSFWQSIFL